MNLENALPELEAGERPPPPPSSRPRSVPPPLPPEAARIPAARAAADEAFAGQMMGRLAAGDYAGALLAAEALLEYRPLDPDARDTAQMARSELRRVYVERLGSLDRVPRLAVSLESIHLLPTLDARSAFLLARVDGVASLRAIAEAGGLHATEALRVLSELHLRRAITFDE